MTQDIDDFDVYPNHLAQALGHADRHAGLKGYCSGLVLPLTRKSVERQWLGTLIHCTRARGIGLFATS